MSRGAFLSNGVDSEFADGEEGRNQRALQAQLEALGSTRRHVISTQGYKEDIKFETRSLRAVENARRVNNSGTAESRISSDVKKGLSGWGNAWKELKGDGTADDSLDSMNDGQTHREKLMSDPSVRDYKEGSEDFGHGSHGRHGAADRSRGGGRGGRGGGHMGSRAGRAGRYGPARVPTGVDLSMHMSMELDKRVTKRKGRGAFLDSPPDKAFYSSSRSAMQEEKALTPTRKPSGVPARIESKLASPSSFMAAAQPKTSVRKTQEVPVTQPKANVKKMQEVPVAPSNAPTAPRNFGGDRPALATPNAFMAAAKNMFKKSSSTKVDLVLPSIKGLPLKEEPKKPTLATPVKAEEPRKPTPEMPVKAEEPKKPTPEMPVKAEEPKKPTSKTLVKAEEVKKLPEVTTTSKEEEPKKQPITKLPVKDEKPQNIVAPPKSEIIVPAVKVHAPTPTSTTVEPMDLDGGNISQPIAAATTEQISMTDPVSALPEEPATASQPVGLQAEINRLLSMLGNTMSPDLLKHLQGVIPVQDVPSTSVKAGSAASWMTPKIVVKIPQPVIASVDLANMETSPTKPSGASAETLAKHDALPIAHNLSLTPSNATTTVKLPAAIERVAAQALKTRPPVTRPPQSVRTIGNTVHINANILGEHVFKDRYAPRSELIVSPVESAADSLDSVSAAFGSFSFKDQINATPTTQMPTSAAKDMAELDTPAPAKTAQDVQPGPVKSRFIAKNTPYLIDNAVTRQYLGKSANKDSASLNSDVRDVSQMKIAEEAQQPPAQSRFIPQAASNLIGDGVTRSATAKDINTPPSTGVEQGYVKSRFVSRETSSLIDNATTRQYSGEAVSSRQQYATSNPFAEPSSKQSSIAPRAAPAENNPFVQPVLKEKPRASIPASSYKATSVAAKEEDSPPKQRYATTPYDWLEPPKRPGETRATKLELPAFLQGTQPNKDTAASARAQYNCFAMKENQAPAKAKH